MKKKILSLAVVLGLAVSLFTNVSFGAENIIQEKPVTIKTTYTYEGVAEKENATLIMTVYDSDKKIVGADYVPFKMGKKGGKVAARVAYSEIGDSESYKVKCYLYKSGEISALQASDYEVREIYPYSYPEEPLEITKDLTETPIKINAFGDSITMGQYVLPAEKGYHDFWEEEYNIVSNNYGKGGSSVSTWSDSVSWDSFPKRVEMLDTTADMVFIMGGTNDCMRNIALGEIDSFDASTFYGGYNTILESIMENFPNKHIVLATPMYYTSKWGNSDKIPEYADAVKAIGEKYNLPVVDLLVEELDFREKGTEYLSDELHPTYLGHSIVAKYIMEQLMDMGIMKELSIEERYGKSLKTVDFKEPRVTDFYQNKDAAVTITFDDAYFEAGKYFNNVFKQLKLSGTAMMVADYVENEEGETVALWQDILDDGLIEVGSHSKTHSFGYSTGTYTPEQLVDDIIGGYDALKKMFPGEKIMTFAPPWTQITTDSLAETKKRYFSSRGGGDGYVDALPVDDVLFNLPAHVVTMPNDTAEKLNAYIDGAIENKQWYIELLHGVSDEFPESTSYDIYKPIAYEHFRYIASKKNKVWVATLGEMTAYIYEHKNAQIDYLWIRENAMCISLKDNLDDYFFDVPLTIEIEVPSSWTNAKVRQGNTVVDITCSDGVAYIDAIPDRGSIMVVKN